MNVSASVGDGAASLQYLTMLAGLVGMLVAAMVALMQCNITWLNSWFKLGWLSDLLLSRRPRQRRFILRHMVGLAACLAGLVALNYGASRGVVDPSGCRWLTWSALAIMAGVYTVLRSGLHMRCSDPSLVWQQQLFAVSYLAWGYYLGGPCKPVALVLLCVVLMFSIFTSTPRILARTCLFSTLAFGTVMLRVAAKEADLPNGPQVQLVYFCVLLIMQLCVYLLVQQLTRLRAKSTRRKHDLAQALERIQDLATRDSLTGLFNRRHMDELMQAEAQRCQRGGRSLCVALIDVDHFKAVNDAHGHGVGDEVLAAVARILAEGVREGDIVSRWGGEEFVVMFADADEQVAGQVLARVQYTLGAQAVSHRHAGLRITFSAGLAMLERDEQLASTIDRADQWLYAAKAAGRNRVMPTAALLVDRRLAG